MFLPSFYDKKNVGLIYPIDYKKIRSDLSSMTIDNNFNRNALVLLSCQNQFLSNKEIINSIVEFIYYNIEKIDDIFVPLIAYPYFTIFSPSFWVDRNGRPLKSGTIITLDGIKRNDFNINKSIKKNFPSDDKNALHNSVIKYIELLKRDGEDFVINNYPLSFGSVNSSLISSIEEAVFSHSIIHQKQPYISVVHQSPFSEYDSVFTQNIPDIFLSLKLITIQNMTLAKRISQYKNVIFASTVSEILTCSIIDFLNITSFSDEIYSNHSYTPLYDSNKKGKNSKNLQIINSNHNIISYNPLKLRI